MLFTLQSGSFDQLKDFKGFDDLGTFLRTVHEGKAFPNCPGLIPPATPIICVEPKMENVHSYQSYGPKKFYLTNGYVLTMVI